MATATTAQISTALRQMMAQPTWKMLTQYRGMTATQLADTIAKGTNTSLNNLVSSYLPSGTTLTSTAAKPTTTAGITTTPGPAQQTATTAAPKTTTTTAPLTAAQATAQAQQQAATTAAKVGSVTLPEPNAAIKSILTNATGAPASTVTDSNTNTTYYLLPGSTTTAQWYAVPAGSSIATPVNYTNNQPMGNGITKKDRKSTRLNSSH